MAQRAPDAAVATVPRPGRRRRVLRWVLLALALAPLAYAGARALTWPDVAALARENPKTTAFIERAKAREARAGRPARVRWAWVSYGAISPHMKRAVIVAEDINFFTHNGFEVAELKIAVRDALAGRRVPRGASTITQQVAKNLWLSPSRSPVRKIEEAILTRQLERHLDKRRILEIYLNVAELAPGVYGAEAAAQRFWGVGAAALSEEQAAALAAGLSRPSRWHPGSASTAYRSRVRSVLRRMERAEFLWRQI